MPTEDRELLKALQDLLRQHKLEVDRAIAAHAEWKARLTRGVAEGRLEESTLEVLRDDRCELGRWLHRLPAETRAERAWALVRDMHANFHREASEIVALVHEGDLHDARMALEPDAPFEIASRRLLDLLEEWRAAA